MTAVYAVMPRVIIIMMLTPVSPDAIRARLFLNHVFNDRNMDALEPSASSPTV